MGDRYSLQTFKNTAVTTATTGQVVIGPISVQEFEYVAFGFRNEFTAASVVAIHMQWAFETDANASAASGAPNWVDIPTATIAWPSSILPSATVMAPTVTNAVRYVRILAGVTATPLVISGGLTVFVGGHKHHG